MNLSNLKPQQQQTEYHQHPPHSNPHHQPSTTFSTNLSAAFFFKTQMLQMLIFQIQLMEATHESDGRPNTQDHSQLNCSATQWQL